MDEIISKLEAIRQAYPDQESQEVLADWEKQAKVAVITKNLQENDAIKLIIAQYRKELNDLNKILQDNEALFEDEAGRLVGKMIHTRKKWCKQFLNIFTVASATVDNVSKQLDTIIEE
jgi:rRNA processing protein Krr1/Pno1